MKMLRWTMAAVCLALLAAVALPATAWSAGDVERITPEALAARQGEEGLSIIDVRTAGSYDNSKEKIKGAVREDPYDAAAWAGRYDKAKPIVLYCS